MGNSTNSYGVCVGGDEHWGQHSGDSLWLNTNLICFENVEMLKLASFVTISILAQLLQEQNIAYRAGFQFYC